MRHFSRFRVIWSLVTIVKAHIRRTVKGIFEVCSTSSGLYWVHDVAIYTL